MTRTQLVTVASVALIAAGMLSAETPASSQTAAQKPLTLYVIDVEGGKADLWVTPSGESLLIDTGSPGNATFARDADRIMEAIADAGVTKLDYLLITHYHVDHAGNVLELAKRIPISTFMDHGATVEDGVDGHQNEQIMGFQVAYKELYSKAKHVVLKPGDTVPLKGVDWKIVTAAGQALKTPIAGALGAGRQNPECAEPRVDVPRDPENGQSVGSLVAYGGFRLLDMGDMTRDKEYDLMCPNNPIGIVDVFDASNHGTNNANAAVLLHAIQPRVLIAQNGVTKGASVDMFKNAQSSAGFVDSWLLHWSTTAGLEWNPPAAFIANGVDSAAIATVITAPPAAAGGGGGGGGRNGGGAPAGGPAPAPGAPAAGAPASVGPQAATAPGAPGAQAGRGGAGGGGRGGGAPLPPHTPAYWIKLAVLADGTYTVTNSRNGFSKTYLPVAKTMAATPARATAAPASARPATPARGVAAGTAK